MLRTCEKGQKLGKDYMEKEFIARLLMCDCFFTKNWQRYQHAPRAWSVAPNTPVDKCGLPPRGNMKGKLRYRLCWESPAPKNIFITCSIAVFDNITVSEHGLHLQALQWMAKLLRVKLHALQVCCISWAFIHRPASRWDFMNHTTLGVSEALHVFADLPLLSWKFTLMHSFCSMLCVENTKHYLYLCPFSRHLLLWSMPWT